MGDLNKNWPTVPKLLGRESRQSGSYWRTTDKGGNHIYYLDCFTDVGASPIPNTMLNQWIGEGVEAGIHLRKPHIIFDEMRDFSYPLLLGSHLGLNERARVFYSNSGTEAVEAAIKLVRKATGRELVVGIEGDFHGRTYGALSLSYPLPHYHFDGFGPFVDKIESVNEETVKGLDLQSIAAVVLSPVNGNNTLRDWPNWVWDFVEVVRHTGGMIVFDEVQTGFGRAGGVVSITETDWWDSHVGIRPDVFVFGKAAGAGWPFSLTVAHEKDVVETMTSGTHFNTMAGSPMGCYLSARLIGWLEDGWLERMLKRAERIVQAHPQFFRRGYMMAVDTPSPRGFVEACLRERLLVMTARDHEPVRFSPPFFMTTDEEDKLMARLRRVFNARDEWE